MEEIKNTFDNLRLLVETERIMIQTKNIDLTYEIDLDSNFEDRTAFVSGISRFLEETTILNNFNNMINIGNVTYASMLYSWRSITKTLPLLTDDIDKSDYYQTVHDVLSDEMKIIYDFENFVVKEAIPIFINEFNKLLQLLERKETLSNGIVFTMTKCMDMFFMLDNLKDAKVSIKNDFSTFKRFFKNNILI